MQAIPVSSDPLVQNPQRVAVLAAPMASAYESFHIIRRNGAVVAIEPS